MTALPRSMPSDIAVRVAAAADAPCLSALATQVFLETYATGGIRLALAREVESHFSVAAFLERLAEPDRWTAIAERAGHMVAFVEVVVGAGHPLVASSRAAEVARLYVQSPFLRRGIGSLLLQRAEAFASAGRASTLWLTAWIGNGPALAFYAGRGYEEVGSTDYTFEGETFENRLFARTLPVTVSDRAPIADRKKPEVAAGLEAVVDLARHDETPIATSNTKCFLRRWRDDDRASLVRHANNRKVWRNLTHRFPHPYTAADAQTWVTLANEPSASIHLAIVLDGEAVGGIGAIAGEGISERTAQFGYWLGEEHWHKGLATAAAQAMVEHLRDRSAFARLEAPVFAWNQRSMRVLEKAGFVREGVLRRSVSKDGELVDSVMYALVGEA